MLTTKEKVKALLGISGSSEDAVLDSLIGSFTAFFETQTSRKIEQITVTDYFNGGEQDLFLSNLPVLSVTSVKQNAGTQAVPDWQTVAAGDYTTYFDIGMIRHASAFPSGSRNIEVVYSSGYAAVPADIDLIAQMLVARVYEQRRAQGKSSESIGDANVSWKTDLTDEQKATIASYRKIHI